MAKRLYKPQWPNDEKFYSRDEEEIFNFDYEGTSDTHPIFDISSSIKLPHPDSSKENVELSLEVEIADSLKHLITSPERKNSALLDVTIVRPTDLDFFRGLDTSNTLAFKSSEVRNLIASMEREKQHKKKLIEECKKKAAASKINTINETHETNPSTNSKHTLTRNEERAFHKHRLKRPENATYTRNNITVMSAPPKCSLHVDYKLDKMHYTANPEMLKYKVGEAYTNSAPISVLKPLVGEIKESLKHLEASISKIGDRSSNSDIQRYEKRFISTSDSNLSSEVLHRKHDKTHYTPEAFEPERLHTHQVYAAAGNYDKLRNLLACQNSEQRDQSNEKPCMCHHCGMVGLLIESQKRPIMPPSPAKKPDVGWLKNDNRTKTQKLDHETVRMARKEMSKNSHADKTKANDENVWIIHDLSSRLEALELRVAAQEQRAVPKDYFKRVINKLWHKHNSDSLHAIAINNPDRTQHCKDHATQYSIENLENILTMKKEPKTVRHRNVQIQQNTKRNFCVNPVLVAQMELENQTQLNDSQEFGSSKNVGTKTINAISEFFTKKTESNKKCAETNTPKERSSAMESFWRWGEEIIKPGFDLKIKILSLLDEQFHNTKTTKDSDNKSTTSKKSEFNLNSPKSSLPKTTAAKASSPTTNLSKTDLPKTNLPKSNVPKTTSLKHNSTTANNLFEAPLPFEDKEFLKNPKQTKNEENVAAPGSSSRTLKKMLDMMSEKIYNDHVKPTVEAIKQEQKSFNNENTMQIYNIKAAMDEALCKINTKETQISKALNINEATSKGQEWQKDFLEPLEVPTSIKNMDDDLNHYSKSARLSKKSAIPVRVSNPSPTESRSARNTKYVENKRSLIPCLKSTVKDWSDCKTQTQNNKSAKGIDKTQKRERYESQHKRTSGKKYDTHYVIDSETSKKDNKHVLIKYLNPKIETWNEESGASIQTEPSEENQQVMLTDKSKKCEKLPDNNTEEKRRIFHKHSVTDKLAFLTKLTKAEMGKADIWNNILKQAENHCRSKQDTVIIQIPTKNHYKHNGIGITEVEFTIEDIQKLVKSSKLDSSVDVIHQESVDSNNMESFLLIRSRKILEEIHKRIRNSFTKNDY